MSDELADGRRRWQEKKEAAGLTDLSKLGDYEEMLAGMRRAIAGFDIDVDELLRQMSDVGRIASIGSMLGMTTGTAAGVPRADGVAIGLMIVEARAREEARS